MPHNEVDWLAKGILVASRRHMCVRFGLENEVLSGARSYKSGCGHILVLSPIYALVWRICPVERGFPNEHWATSHMGE